MKPNSNKSIKQVSQCCGAELWQCKTGAFGSGETYLACSKCHKKIPQSKEENNPFSLSSPLPERMKITTANTSSPTPSPSLSAAVDTIMGDHSDIPMRCEINTSPLTEKKCEHSWKIVSYWGVSTRWARRECSLCSVRQDKEITEDGWKKSPKYELSKCNAEANGIKCLPPCELCYGGRQISVSPSTEWEENLREDWKMVEKEYPFIAVTQASDWWITNIKKILSSQQNELREKCMKIKTRESDGKFRHIEVYKDDILALIEGKDT